MNLFTFVRSFLHSSLPPFLPVLTLLFVSVFNIASLPQEICHRICDPWWCAAIIGSAAAISSGYWLFLVFVLSSLQRRCNGKGNDVSNSLLLRLVIGLMRLRHILSQSDCYKLLQLIFPLLALATWYFLKGEGKVGALKILEGVQISTFKKRFYAGSVVFA